MSGMDVAKYQIEVEGMLDPGWHECLAGLNIAVCERPQAPSVTVLSGPLVDQAALQGVLATLFMLQMPLLRVERLSRPTAEWRNG